jgi:putative iron-only hydrogenase system regulator
MAAINCGFFLVARPCFALQGGAFFMEKSIETRVALLGIVVEDSSAISSLNDLLHEYGSHIIGRMGLPYREKGISIISIVLDAPGDVISALSGKLGMIRGISTKTLYAKVKGNG